MTLFVRLLSDLDTDLLVAGLSEALTHTTKDWLTPGAIRELCMGGSQADLDAAAADEAWNWIVKWRRDHGVWAEPKRGALIANVDGEPVFAPDTPAPPIPNTILRALQMIAPTIHEALNRIGLCETGMMHFLKKEFATAYGRARRLG